MIVEKRKYQLEIFNNNDEYKFNENKKKDVMCSISLAFLQ